jgi:hypothetical protein
LLSLKPAAVPTSTPSTSPEPVAVKIPAMPTSFADLEERYEGIPYASWKFTQEKLEATKSTDLKNHIQIRSKYF